MKRNENLQQLSRDHHHGLLLGWKIRQGLRNHTDLGIIKRYVLYFASESLWPHFEAEETQLLIFLPGEDPMRQRTLDEHQVVRQLVSELSEQEVSEAELLELADFLDAHIRFEERQLFAHIQQSLPDASLSKIRELIASTHQPFVETFEHEFWKEHHNK